MKSGCRNRARGAADQAAPRAFLRTDAALCLDNEDCDRPPNRAILLLTSINQFRREPPMQPPLTSVTLSDESTPASPRLPPRPRSIEETGLALSYVSDLVLRALYLVGEMTGVMLVDMLHLPYENVIDQAILYLRREQ